MRNTWWMVAVLGTYMALVSGCGGAKPTDAKDTKKTASADHEGHDHDGHDHGDHEDHDHDDHDDHGHDHGEAGPNGGELQEIDGGKAGHLEIKLDHKTGTAHIFLLDMKLKPMPIADAPKVSVMTDDGAAEVEVKALEAKDGKAWKYEAAHAALKSHPANGQVKLTIGGKAMPALKLDAHDH